MVYRLFLTTLCIIALGSTDKTLSASSFELEGIYQQTQGGVYDGLYRPVAMVWIQNGSPGAPDYGGGVGTVSEAVVDIGSLLGEVIDVVVTRNPAYQTREEAWERLGFYISSYKREVYYGWFLDFDQYTPNLRGADNYGAPNEFEHYLVFRHGYGDPGADYNIWKNYNTDPDNDALIFGVEFFDLLDFDQDGRVDPDEILIWDGRTGCEEEVKET